MTKKETKPHLEKPRIELEIIKSEENHMEKPELDINNTAFEKFKTKVSADANLPLNLKAVIPAVHLDDCHNIIASIKKTLQEEENVQN